MQIKKINLSPIEATAYWWVQTINKKLIEIEILNDNKEEREFLSNFKDFTDVEWRILYLELTKYISKKVNNISNNDEAECYHQDTAKKYHNDINEVLCSVLKTNIPDINLTLSGIESSAIYTNQYGADRVYDISGIVKLDTIYDSNYILSGDEKELEMKNLIMYLIDLEVYNKSLESLKEIFCEFYSNLHDVDKELLEDDFMRIYNQLSDQGLVDNLNFEQSDNKLLNKTKKN